MLEKESDHCEVSTAKGLLFKDGDTNVFVDNSGNVTEENSVSCGLINQPDLVFLNKNDKTDNPVDDSSAGEGWEIPAGYQLLPQKFFNIKGIPPPLVSVSWLELLNGKDSDGDSGEDLPLSKLRNKLQKKRKKKKALNSLKSSNKSENKNACDESSGFKQIKKLSKRKKLKKSKVETNEFSPVNRRRGRPRKCENKPVVTNPDNDLSNDFDELPKSDSDEFFWNDQNNQNASSDLVIPLQEYDEVENEKEKDNSLVINHTEHDYFKAPEITDSVVKEVKNVLKRKKKEKNPVQGIRTGDSKISFPCIECGKTFSAASTLKSHLRIHNGTLLICTECHRGFTTKYLLKCHMRIHSGDLFMCHKCGKGFITAELLKVHSRGHTGDRPFFCDICKRSFPSASNLSQHKQTHNSEKKFLCFQCGSSFSQKRCLDGHMLTHAEKNHICNVCGKLWARKSDLSEHMRVHTGVKPYCCNLCPQKFTQASSLKRHKIVHTDVKPIQCLTCSKLFKCKEYYKRHLRKHEKDADYLFTESIIEYVEDK